MARLFQINGSHMEILLLLFHSLSRVQVNLLMIFSIPRKLLLIPLHILVVMFCEGVSLFSTHWNYFLLIVLF